MDDMRADLDRLIELLRVVRLHRIQGWCQAVSTSSRTNLATAPRTGPLLCYSPSWSRDSFGDSALAGLTGAWFSLLGRH